MVEIGSIDLVEYMLDNNIISIEEAVIFTIECIHNVYITIEKRRHLIEILVKRGANLNIQSDDGTTILHNLCANIGYMDAHNDGSNLIYQDKFYDILELIRFLLENGADPLLHDKEGEDAFYNCKYQIHYLQKTQKKKFLKLLKEWS